MRRTLAGTLLCVVVALAAACAERERLCPCPDRQKLDERLMVLLATARAYHHQADIYLQQGELEQAMQAVRRILKLELDARWPEAEEVRLDAAARLAKLLLGRGKTDEALDVTRSGIRAARRESFYLSNLHSVRGEIIEHRVKELDRAGRRQEARDLARQAIAAFEKSIEINKRLQRRLLQQQQGH